VASFNLRSFDMAKNKHHGGDTNAATSAADNSAPTADTSTPVGDTPAAAPAAQFKHDKKLPLVGSYTPESTITWNTTVNPRMPGRATFDRFAKYLGANTVKAYTEAGGTKGDLLWDLRSGYLNIEGVTLGGELTPRKPKQPPKPRAKKEKAEKVADTSGDDVEAAQAGMVSETI
jgi:hypothetical protein